MLLSLNAKINLDFFDQGLFISKLLEATLCQKSDEKFKLKHYLSKLRAPQSILKRKLVFCNDTIFISKLACNLINLLDRGYGHAQMNRKNFNCAKMSQFESA